MIKASQDFQSVPDISALDLTGLILHGVKLKNSGRMLRRPLHVIRANYTLDTSRKDSCCRDVLPLFLLRDFQCIMP